MEADGALDKARKHKKRQLEDTLNLVLKKRKGSSEIFFILGSSLLSLYLAKPYGCSLIFRVNFTMARAMRENGLVREVAEGELCLRGCRGFEVRSSLDRAAWVEFWHPRILTDLTRGIGIPLKFDHSTIAGNYGHFARVLIVAECKSVIGKVPLKDGSHGNEKENKTLVLNHVYKSRQVPPQPIKSTTPSVPNVKAFDVLNTEVTPAHIEDMVHQHNEAPSSMTNKMGIGPTSIHKRVTSWVDAFGDSGNELEDDDYADDFSEDEWRREVGKVLQLWWVSLRGSLQATVDRDRAGWNQWVWWPPFLQLVDSWSLRLRKVHFFKLIWFVVVRSGLVGHLHLVCKLKQIVFVVISNWDWILYSLLWTAIRSKEIKTNRIFTGIEKNGFVAGLGVSLKKASFAEVVGRTSSQVPIIAVDSHSSLPIRKGNLVSIRINDAAYQERVAFYLAREIGIPLKFDHSIIAGNYDHYARVLINVDLAGFVLEKLLLETINDCIEVELYFESFSDFCTSCYSVGHSLAKCKSLIGNVPFKDGSHVNEKENKTPILNQKVIGLHHTILPRRSRRCGFGDSGNELEDDDYADDFSEDEWPSLQGEGFSKPSNEFDDTLIWASNQTLWPRFNSNLLVL
ncbi:hypothetical protein FNV43_RR04583 [Rhamnella rubrinervis]|uniref:Zinc knuckle CX2CX4HX4C n=1 Tax=Rhamnella rubrinervis TaxID=2594499 RepID=A0A8K0HKH2_9ROSA|nr:hypothetical protein FNV43_RR04583 [Rhamnella rubrinervis]